MRSFADPTGIRIIYEHPVKMRIQNPVNSVMDEPVADAGFVDVSRLRVVYFERLISAVPICFIL